MEKIAFFAFAFLFLSIGPAHAQNEGLSTFKEPTSRSLEEKNSALDYDWRTSLSGMNSNGESGQSKLVDFRLEFKVNYRMNSALTLDLAPIFKFQSGTQQTLNAADKADNRLLLGQAGVHFTPWEPLTLSAGALNQGYFHSSLLIDSIPFPAARMEARLYQGEKLHLGLIGESAIPTSSSLSTNTNDLEPTPSLNSAALRFSVEDGRHLYWKNTAGYFAYDKLPGSVAAESYLLGNSVERLSDSEGVFEYAYQGIEAQTEARLPAWRAVDLFAGAEYVRNTRAPSRLNTAYQYYGGTEIYLRQAMSLSLRGSYFRIEPDATVAYFSANRYFNTNRVGYAAEAYLNFHRDSFRVGLRYNEAEVLFESPVQSHERSLLLRLETTYADI